MPALPTVAIPDPFASALNENAPSRVADAPAESAAALFGRAQARSMVGRHDDARTDLEAALDELGPPVRIELALLDILQRSAIADAQRTMQIMASQRKVSGVTRGRALHVYGLACGKLRENEKSVAALLEAAQLYRDAGDRAQLAQVLDTLGQVEAARGRLDLAANYFALSLVDKTLLGDRYGMAITLGNLGRVHLQAGRFDDAVYCLERDRELAESLGDHLGVARMHNDLARAHLAAGALDKAGEHLDTAVQLADKHGFDTIRFFSLKDRARLHVQRGDVKAAEADLKLAEAAVPPRAEPYLHDLLKAARGEALAARAAQGTSKAEGHTFFRGAKDDAAQDALALLTEAVEGFAKHDVPDHEISARLTLAKVQVHVGEPGRAGRTLLDGLRIARRDGFARYLPALNEAMAMLPPGSVPIDEAPRGFGVGPDAPPNGYHILAELGGGAFGKVYRVYDPQRGRELALKQLKLGDLYDAKRRGALVASARVELEAAAGVRHPGVCRVYAFGHNPEDGETYIVQELIHGRPLSDIMPGDNRERLDFIIPMVMDIANALHALHDGGIIHRDLKPANILLRDGERPVLVDFGVAHVHQFHGRKAAERLVGTLAYMAPEQAMRKPNIDGRADLYALGVIFYEWLTGTLPLWPKGDNTEEMLDDIATRMPRPVAQLRPGTPEPVAGLVHELLAKKPRHRPSSGHEVATRCRDILANLPPEPDDIIDLPPTGPGSVPGSVPGSIPGTARGATRITGAPTKKQAPIKSDPDAPTTGPGETIPKTVDG